MLGTDRNNRRSQRHQKGLALARRVISSTRLIVRERGRNCTTCLAWETARHCTCRAGAISAVCQTDRLRRDLGAGVKVDNAPVITRGESKSYRNPGMGVFSLHHVRAQQMQEEGLFCYDCNNRDFRPVRQKRLHLRPSKL